MRLQHAADGTISLRPDQAQYEALNENLALQKHVIKSNAVWDLPNAPSRWGKVGEILLNDWQLSGVLTAGSAYRPGAIQANGNAQANPASRLQRGRAQQRPLRPRLHLPEQRRAA